MTDAQRLQLVLLEVAGTIRRAGVQVGPKHSAEWVEGMAAAAELVEGMAAAVSSVGTIGTGGVQSTLRVVDRWHQDETLPLEVEERRSGHFGRS